MRKRARRGSSELCSVLDVVCCSSRVGESANRELVWLAMIGFYRYLFVLRKTKITRFGLK